MTITADGGDGAAASECLLSLACLYVGSDGLDGGVTATTVVVKVLFLAVLFIVTQ